MSIVIPVGAVALLIVIVICVVLLKRRRNANANGAAGRAVINFQNPLFKTDESMRPQDASIGEGIYRDINFSSGDGISLSNPLYSETEGSGGAATYSQANAGYPSIEGPAMDATSDDAKYAMASNPSDASGSYYSMPNKFSYYDTLSFKPHEAQLHSPA